MFPKYPINKSGARFSQLFFGLICEERNKAVAGMCRLTRIAAIGLAAARPRLLAATFLSALCAYSQSVLMQHNDIGRTGQNTNETILTPANVNSDSFGKLFSLSVDGFVYAQPLYLPNLAIPGKGNHNAVFVATEHDSVYAFDADTNSGANATPLWKASLLDTAHGAAPGARTVTANDIGSSDIVPEIGITGTPVIDANSGTIYVVGKTVENGTFVQRLHALDVTTGNEKFNGPVVLQASVPGTGNGSSGGVLQFDPKWSHNRPGLLLLNGIVYIAFGAHGDNGPWHGWILSYAAGTLNQTGALCTTPNGIGSGIWMSGAGVAADVIDPVNAPFGRMFVATGNGTYNASTPYGSNMDFGDDELRLDLNGGVPTVSDAFTPSNQLSLDQSDEDFGAGGTVLLPDQTSGSHTHLLVQTGKSQVIYVIDRDNLGGYNNTDRIVQEVGGLAESSYSSPAYWNNNLYFWGVDDHLRMFTLSNGHLSNQPVSISSENFGYPGATPVVSANGASNGIVWALQTDAYGSNGPAVLHAHDAANVARTLYTSNQNSSRDNPGSAIKYAVPTVVNGKVYVGAQKQISVYGLLGGQQAQAAAPQISPGSESFSGSLTVSITDNTPGASIFYTTDGSTPSEASILYTGPISITTSTAIKAIASAPGLSDSPLSTALYNAQGGSTGVDFSNGFSTAISSMTFNGSTRLDDSRLQLTDGGTREAGTAFTNRAFNIQSFTTDFNFQLSSASADGFTFTIQSSTPRAIGATGGGLGYGASTAEGKAGIPNSVAVKFDFFNNAGEGSNSTGLYLNGASPTVPATDLSDSGINLVSGDSMTVHLTYDGTTLAMTITDFVTNSSFSKSWPVNIPSVIGSNNAFLGFTGGTGGLSASQKILTWTFASTSTPSGTPPGTVTAETNRGTPGDIRSQGDFDGDGKLDDVFWRPSNGTWYVRTSNDPTTLVTKRWGQAGDIPMPADYDGDGITDYTVWRPSNGTWYIQPGSGGSPINVPWGLPGDIPVAGVQNAYGRGESDLAVWRPSNGTWYITTLLGPTQDHQSPVQWGLPGDIPFAGAATRNGASQLIVWRPSTGVWYTYGSSPSGTQWGLPGDVPVPGDYDNDGLLDFAVWRPSNGNLYVRPSSHPGSPYTQQLNSAFDVLPTKLSVGGQGRGVYMYVKGDFDGDGLADFALWSLSNSIWYIVPSSTGTPYTMQWGARGDVPMPGYYDGDKKTDVAVWRPSNGTWYVVPSSTAAAPNSTTNGYSLQWGLPGDFPVSGEFDIPGQADFAVWRPSEGNWYIRPVQGSAPYTVQWGLPGDIPVAGDYTGGSLTDFAVWRPSEGNWYVNPNKRIDNSLTPYVKQWGARGDVPVFGDYDGDGKADFSIWRPSNQQGYFLLSGSNYASVQQPWDLNATSPMFYQPPVTSFTGP